MTAPSYRGLVDYSRFRTKMGTASALMGADVIKATCEAVVCTVTIKLDAQPLIPGVRGKLSTGYDEKWVYEDGEWWLHQ